MNCFKDDTRESNLLIDLFLVQLIPQSKHAASVYFAFGLVPADMSSIICSHSAMFFSS